jgi:hypothetical protein
MAFERLRGSWSGRLQPSTICSRRNAASASNAKERRGSPSTVSCLLFAVCSLSSHGRCVKREIGQKQVSNVLKPAAKQVVGRHDGGRGGYFWPATTA